MQVDIPVLRYYMRTTTSDDDKEQVPPASCESRAIMSPVAIVEHLWNSTAGN
jgi:hypothetical protein